MLEVSSQSRQAVCKTSHTACLQLLGNFKHTCPTPFGVQSKKKNFGGCSQRLTLKDFTTMSWIRDNKGPGVACYWAIKLLCTWCGHCGTVHRNNVLTTLPALCVAHTSYSHNETIMRLFMPPDVGTVYRQWRILAHLWRGGQRGQHSTPSRPLSVIRHFDAKTTPSIMTNKNYEQFKVFIKILL